MADPLELSVSEFVAYANQTLEYAYPSVVIVGELANFRVSKNKWVYFDLKDDEASIRFFGTVYMLRTPLEDGMLLKVRGTPRLHAQYGFSITVQQIALVGEGTIKRASNLLEAKLAKEGIFDPARKRPIPYPPQHIGLITSGESAAYSDFMKVLAARWGGVDISLADVQVQGADAATQIVDAIQACNQSAVAPEVLVLIRGGGSAEDLQAFSDERVVRAVAASRIPTIVAIGHERDVSLAELAADQRASTPSNAAELLVPDRDHVRVTLRNQRDRLGELLAHRAQAERQLLQVYRNNLISTLQFVFAQQQAFVRHRRALLAAYDPELVLRRGYAILQADQQLRPGDIVGIETWQQQLQVEIKTAATKKKGA